MMMKSLPRFLYKYTGKRLDRIGDILVNRRLHFSDPIKFNDPFDCALDLDLQRGASDQDWVEYFTHLVEEEEPDSAPSERRARAVDNVKRGRHKDPVFVNATRNDIRQIVKELGRKQGVLCLSSDPKNVMMWAHYADNHEGLLFRFDCHYMADQKSGELRTFPINYNVSFPRIPDYLKALGQSKNGDLRAVSKLFFCRKSRDWKNEKEWRFFSSKPNSFVEFDEPMLSGIIFGWKMPDSTKNLIRAWTNEYNPKPKLFEAKPCPDRFRMDISPI